MKRYLLPSLVLLLLPLAAAQSEPALTAAPAASAWDGAPTNVGLDYLLALPDHLDDPAFLDRAVLAQLEQQGAYDPGTTHAVSVSVGLGPPQRVFFDHYVACDFTGDGVRDLFTHEYEGSSYIAGINGATGAYDWVRSNLRWIPLDTLTRGLYPAKVGEASPSGPENVDLLPDVNGDGVCDVLAMGFTSQFILQNPPTVRFDVTVHALNGKDGKDLWRRTFQSYVVQSLTTPVPQTLSLQIIGFPTGMLAVDSPSGPKYVIKFTDVQYFMVRDNVATGYFVNDYRVNDRIHYADATIGDDVWTQPINYDTNNKVSNFTWLAGAENLNEGPEPEVLLYQYYITTPRGNLEQNDPLTGRPFYRWGKGMVVRALNSDQLGLELWRTAVREEGPATVNLQSEEKLQTLRWTYAYVLPDVTGDGVADVAALYLAQELGSDVDPEAPTNQRMRIHAVPLHGHDGSRLWKGDHEYRGWGYLAALNLPGTKAPYLALGTVDVPMTPAVFPGIQSEVVPGGRFPVKEWFVRVLDIDDGSQVWDYHERYSQDNYLSYHFALMQFRKGLAPFDFDGDGVKDLVTPSEYVPPVSHYQSLLSMANHTYEVLGSVSQETLMTVRAWGSNGLVATCPGAEDKVTVVSGHARRLDASRFDVATGRMEWRQPIFNDGKIQAASRGTDFIGVTTYCQQDGDRTFVAANLFRSSAGRGFEIIPIRGFLDVEGEIQWLVPGLFPDPGIRSFIELLPQPPAHPTSVESAVQRFTPAVLGLGAGLGLGVLRTRTSKEEELL